MNHAERGKPVLFSVGRNAQRCGVVRPQGRGTEVPVEDAGKSEGFTVMVEIGVRALPQRESVLTSYASVSERQRRSKP